MKKLLLAGFLLVLTLVCQEAIAQNYQPFRKGLTYHYISQDSIYSMRIDSAKVIAGDSVFVFNQTVKKGTNPEPLPAGCQLNGGGGKYYVQHNNQFGHKMRKKANGDYVFETQQGQTFTLKTKVAVGQSWTFNATQNITATLVAKVLEPVLTSTDSAFAYVLSNGGQIRLTKNYGFLTTPNFVTYADPYFKPKTLQFYALPEKGLGHTISSTFQIYDFQPGDKFAYFKYYNLGIFGQSNCTEEWNRYLVLSRRLSSTGDTLYIGMQREKLYKAYGQAGAPSPFCSIAATTIHTPPTTETWVITAQGVPQTNLLTNSFYAPPATNAWAGAVSRGIVRTSQFNQREQLTLDYNVPYIDCAKAYSYVLDNGYTAKYAVGLGKVYDGKFPMGGSEVEVLEAYVKGNGTETYGRWQSIAQLLGTKEDLHAKPLVKTYPNPFTSELTISFGETSGNVQLTLQNTLGQIVWQKETPATANSEVKIGMPELAKGLYFLHASQNGKTYSSRLVKE